MFRYFAVAWDEADSRACAVGRTFVARITEQKVDWKRTLAAPGLEVFSTGAGASTLLEGEGAGVVVGDLFTSSTRCRRLSAAESERITGSNGRELVAAHWGSYVAFLRNPRTRSIHVLRSPAATLPCFYVSDLDGVTLYFSWTEDCARLNPRAFSIDWSLAARSVMGLFPSRRTSIQEIRELLPGFCIEMQEAKTLEHCYWNPADIARSEPIAAFDEAAEAIHDATQSCVNAWSDGSPHILHALSGGLDSSILLSCLSRAPSHPKVTCLTHYASGPDSDERYFARLAARAAESEHIEHRQPDDIDLRTVLHGVRFERSPGMRMPAIDRIEPDTALENGASAICKGHGGDELFCRHHTHLYIADYLRTRGLRPELLGLLLHSAVMEGETLWRILYGATKDALFPEAWNITQIFAKDQGEQSLLTTEATEALLEDTSYEPPYDYSSRELPPGKLWQITLVTGRRYHYQPSMREGDPQPIAPLLSQPLIEKCLRIPTYLQMKDRRERAVARAAFTGEVPGEILDRRGKGGAEHLAWRLLRRNLPFVRELLLDGRLAQERILDRQRTEAALADSPSAMVKATVPVFHLVGAEAWLQAWTTTAPASGHRP